MKINEAKGLLDDLEIHFGTDSVRLVFKMSKEETPALMEYIKKVGYAAHLQSSAYGDIEVVVTDGDVGPS